MSRAGKILEALDYTEWLCERMSVEERFMKYVKKNQGPLKCWKWTGGKDKYGYGKFCEDSKCAKAHQVSYRLFNGPISPGMEVMHSCDTPDCVCPEHLSLGDHATNMKDRASKGHYGKWRRVREMVSAMFSEEFTLDFEDSVYAFAQQMRNKHHLEKFELAPVEKSLVLLANIQVKEVYRNKGIGSKAMRDLCSWADRKKITLALTPEKDNKTRLEKFYKQFGFTHTSAYSFPGDMRREPR